MGQSNAADLLQRALELPADDRLALATERLNSVEGREDENWNEAWARELDRRSAAVKRGDEALASWDSVESRIRADLSHRWKRSIWSPPRDTSCRVRSDDMSKVVLGSGSSSWAR
jgi:putative addiction module component (TIGR02574 family)